MFNHLIVPNARIYALSLLHRDFEHGKLAVLNSTKKIIVQMGWQEIATIEQLIKDSNFPVYISTGEEKRTSAVPYDHATYVAQRCGLFFDVTMCRNEM